MPIFDNLQPLFGVYNASKPLVIAGPCSAETREQTLHVAESLADLGICCFRAGVWKPRTRPGSFEGVGGRGLRWLAEVRRKTGMIVLTEVATPAHLSSALRVGLRDFWIGARTAANPFAVQDLADAFAAMPPDMRNEISLLVKNPINPDLELWIGTLQRFYVAGVKRLGAIHRGFSVYGQNLYRNAPEWRIPIELKRRIPDIPLICDPSHIGGRADLVAPLAQQAMDMDFDGLMIETHCNPADALSDASQQITPAELKSLLDGLRVGTKSGTREDLLALRRDIDELDDRLVSLLSQRMQVSREIGRLKKTGNMPVVQPDRYRELMERRIREGERLGMSEEFMKDLLSTIHQESVRQQLTTLEDATEGEGKNN